jgi:hypothetical protein
MGTELALSAGACGLVRPVVSALLPAERRCTAPPEWLAPLLPPFSDPLRPCSVMEMWSRSLHDVTAKKESAIS